jgi:hypothetical protein
MVKKLPKDLDIFSLSTLTKPLCIQKRTKSGLLLLLLLGVGVD